MFLVLALLLAVLGGDDCLTPDQKKQVEEAVTIIDGTLKTAAAALDVAALKEQDPDTKKNLVEAAKDIRIIDRDIVKNLTAICEETCGTCTEITDAVTDMVNEIEKTLTDMFPDWKNDPIFQLVVQAIGTILDAVKVACPSSDYKPPSMLDHILLFPGKFNNFRTVMSE